MQQKGFGFFYGYFVSAFSFLLPVELNNTVGYPYSLFVKSSANDFGWSYIYAGALPSILMIRRLN